MIIIELKNYHSTCINNNLYNHFIIENNKIILTSDKLIISNVEVVDNEYDDILIRLNFFDNRLIQYFNLERRYHNPIGPSYLRYNDNFQLIETEHCLNGIVHNIKESAKKYYHKGQIYEEKYFINNKCLSKKRMVNRKRKI